MEQSVADGVPAVAAPRFYLTARQPLRPGAIAGATVGAALALAGVLLALGQTGRVHGSAGDGPGRSGGRTSKPDDKDDPAQVDTIVVGDPADAPVPARRGEHVSPVHPTILVRLPRFGEQVGLIPDSPAGRLLYGWLAAFNHADAGALERCLPTVAPGDGAAGQMELRQETGGFSLLSAKEVQPGVLVFRLRDQTAAGGEVLGTLQVAAGSDPAEIGSFSLRGVR